MRTFTLTTGLLIAILAVSAYLRLWNLPGTLQFLGDQGRDALIVSKIFNEADLVFIGPVTSVGNMYLGPLYYYFMLPFLWLSYPSPLGPVYAVAVLSILTTWLIYYLGRELVGKTAALWGAFFFATSAVVVEFARFSWNPNPAPLASLLMAYSLYKAWQGRDWYWVGVSGAFSALIQLHYLTLLTAPVAGLLWLMTLGRYWKPSVSSAPSTNTATPEVISVSPRTPSLPRFFAATAAAVIVFIVSLTPLIAFDLTHDWLNVKAFSSLISSEENFTRAESDLATSMTQTLSTVQDRSLLILFDIAIGAHALRNTILLIATVALVGLLLGQGTQRSTFQGEAVILMFLFFGIVGTSFYQHTIFPHYIAYLFPFVFLLYGVLAAWLWQRHAVGKIVTGLLAVGFLLTNVGRYPLRTIGWTIQDIKRTSDTISQRLKPGEKYDIVLLSETKDIDAHNYRYYLSTTDHPPVSIQEHGDIDTLFIINEEKKLPKVVDSPIYIIVVFPNKEPAEVYNVPGGPEIMVLRRK